MRVQISNTASSIVMLWRHFFEAFGASARGFVFELRRTIELVRYPHPLHPPALPAVRKQWRGLKYRHAVSDGSGAHDGALKWFGRSTR